MFGTWGSEVFVQDFWVSDLALGSRVSSCGFQVYVWSSCKMTHATCSVYRRFIGLKYPALFTKVSSG